jgi:DNA polymerase-3 subunit gamma/tau
MSQAFYRKWRPRRWEAVVGQDHVVQTLRNAVASGRTVHAYLFAGPRGTGKTTTARLLAKAVNCLDENLANRPCDQCEHCQAVNAGRFLDLIEIDAASNTSVEDVRDLRDKINFSPNQGRYKVYVVDEVHMLSTAAFNALLKTLEEPPPHAVFILATTEVQKIPATVLSRCQRHEFRRIPSAEIVAHLQSIAADEQLEVEPAALALIARQATGSMRDAISLLDQLASGGQPISLEIAQAALGTATSQAVLDLVEALAAKEGVGSLDATQTANGLDEIQSVNGLDLIHRALDAGSDPRQLARQIVDYLRDILLVRMGNADPGTPPEARALMARHAQAFPVDQLLRMIRAFNRAAGEARSAWQPALPLEMAFIESLQPEATQPAINKSPVNISRSTAPPGQPASPSGSNPRTRPAAPPQVPQAEPDPEKPDEEDKQASQQLENRWPQILGTVRRQAPNTYGLLNSCKSRHLKGNVLVLGFASDVLKNQMAKQENLEIVQQALAQVLGAEISVRCIINTARRTTIPADVDTDGMVAAALRDLGGEIVDIQ